MMGKGDIEVVAYLVALLCIVVGAAIAWGFSGALIAMGVTMLVGRALMQV